MVRHPLSLARKSGATAYKLRQGEMVRETWFWGDIRRPHNSDFLVSKLSKHSPHSPNM